VQNKFRECLLPFSREFFIFQFAIKSIEIKTYKTIILPFVVYGCETWSLSLREEHRLKVFENEVLRKIFGPKRKEVTGGCKKLRNGYLYGSTPP
jgi:hypothetical protein